MCILLGLYILKRISYGLTIATIGLNSGREELLAYLKKNSLESKPFRPFTTDIVVQEFFLVYNTIPIKSKMYFSNTVETLVYNFDAIGKVDVLLLTIDITDQSSLNNYNLKALQEFSETYSFRGILILVGIKQNNSLQTKINDIDLINKAKELNTLYCFKIENQKEDLKEFYEKILNDFIFKFEFSSPELFEKAKTYGLELLNQKEIDRESKKSS